MALTQSQMTAAVADRAEMSMADARRALAALDEIALEELGNAQKVRIGGLVQLTVRVKPAQKASGAQPGDRRGDRRSGQAGKRRCPCAAARESQGGASVGAEGAAAARGDKRTRPALAPPGRGTKLLPAVRSPFCRTSVEWQQREVGPQDRQQESDASRDERRHLGESPRAAWRSERNRAGRRAVR